MRPGRITPDNRGKGRVGGGAHGASMRPGRITPDNAADASVIAHATPASMRPGRITPDNTPAIRRPRTPLSRFNEAGANYPG